MRATVTETGTYHQSRSAAGLAAALVANGAPEDLALAEKVLESTLACQELRPDQARYGNFRWMYEDERVRDKNAVEFVLSSLIPMMIRHQDRLSPEMRERVLKSIRLGLDDIREMDVTVAYTNMAVHDIENTCLGGELLNDNAILERGRAKLKAWEAFTCGNGTFFEFNSPTYTAVTAHALGRLIDLVQDPDIRIRARTMAARFGLGFALRIHGATGRLAAPHSRAYHPYIECETSPDVGRIKGWTAHGIVPRWTRHVLDNVTLPMEVTETASRERGIALTTYQSPSFAIGTGTRGFIMYGRQSNLFMVHYARPQADRPGVVYARYLSNDKWLGDWYHTTDRTSSRNLLDEGHFYGVQSGPRAIGVYSAGTFRDCTSAKAVLIWTRCKDIDEIWVGDQPVTDLPAAILPGQVVVVGSGEALLAVVPLGPTDLGGGAIALVEHKGDLVLEMVNYRGPKTSISASGLERYRCAFYAEAAERSQYPDGKTFGLVVARGRLADKVGKRIGQPWSVQYVRDDNRLGLEIDLATWTLRRRWNKDGDLGWPMLESPAARQNASGRVEVGEAVLGCGKHPAWLFADAQSKTWVAGYHGDPAPLKLTTPDGTVRVEAMGTGTVAWEDGVVRVEAVGLRGVPAVAGGKLVD
jgi:hypothetical protein